MSVAKKLIGGISVGNKTIGSISIGNKSVGNVSVGNKSIGGISIAKKSVSLPVFPTHLNIIWVEDFARITFTDNSNLQHEFWESKDGDSYYLVTTLEKNITKYEYATWQNSSLNFKIRGKYSNGTYTDFSEVVNIITPLVFKTDQSILDQIDIVRLGVSGTGKNVNVDWGDGTDTDYPSGSYSNIVKNYTSTGIYFITISGDVDNLYQLDYRNDYNAFGDLSKWKLPQVSLFHWFGHSFTGDISNWVIPANVGIFHIENNQFEGDITDFVFADSVYDLRLSNNSNLEGDISGWNYPAVNGRTYYYLSCEGTKMGGDLTNIIWPLNTKYLSLYNCDLSGDISGWTIPVDCGFMRIGYYSLGSSQGSTFTGDLSGWVLPTGYPGSFGNYNIDLTGYGFTGDLSGWTIPGAIGVNVKLYCSKNNFTKMPRGAYDWMNIFDFSENNCNTSEIDDWLDYLDNYFTGGTIPLNDCTYIINGSGMGIPSAAGLVSKTNIEGKYTAVGKTITITVNS